jgi:uncharacterized damage-inducible protein DinB
MSTAPALNFTPEFATALRGVFLAQLRNEVATTKKVIAAVPNDAAKNSYKPDPKAKSGWELACHIAESDVWFLRAIVKANFNLDEESGTLPKESVKTVPDLAAWYEREMTKEIAEVEKLSAEALAKPVQFFNFNFPNVTYLFFVNNHSVHHRGQLSTYLRPMGSKIPSIYGGSADEPINM